MYVCIGVDMCECTDKDLVEFGGIGGIGLITSSQARRLLKEKKIRC